MLGTTLAQSLDQILAELDAGYTPQKQALQQRIDALPAQADAEVEGLKAQERDYFDNVIMSDARNRGVAFGGIPIGERARYGATQFLPAVARVRQSQNDVRGSLFDALNNVGLDQRKTAMGLYQQQLDRDEQARQFNESLAQQKRQAASSTAALASLYGQTNQNNAPDVYARVDKQGATNAIKALLSTGNRDTINRTIAAITDSANRGNTYDKFKLELLDAYRQNSQYGNLLNGLSSPGAGRLPSFATTQSALSDPLFNVLGGRR